MRLLLLPIILFLSFNVGAMEPGKSDKEERKNYLIEVYKNTCEIIEKGCYPNPNNLNTTIFVPKKEQIKDPIIYQFNMPGEENFYLVKTYDKNKNKYTLREEVPLEKSLRKKIPRVEIILGDILVIANNIVIQNPHGAIALVNAANMHTIRCGAPHGLRGVEEDLFRRSNLSASKAQLIGTFQHNHDRSSRANSACIPLYGTAFHSNITVFKNENYGLLSVPFGINVISSAAFNCKYDVDENYNTGTRAKIEAQFRTAVAQNVDHLIIPAWGCGSFKNEPNFIAEIYRDMIVKYGFYFESITFVFLLNDDNNSSTFSIILNPVLSK